ncbi:TPA: hypothetical protein ACG3KG_003224 [Clostridioides difficile]
MRKYKAAISDTDILINLAKVNRLDILELLFEEITIPHYVYDTEIRKKANRFLGIITSKIHEGGVFKLLNRKDDKIINSIAKPIIDEMYNYIGKGESECAGYAAALGTQIIVSDNTSDFKWLVDENYVPLTHNDIISICVHFNLIDRDEAEDIFQSINSNLDRPISMSFDEVYRRSITRFQSYDLDEYIVINQPV